MENDVNIIIPICGKNYIGKGKDINEYVYAYGQNREGVL